MPTKWTIHADGVESGTNGTKLVGCHLEDTGTNYQFEDKDGNVLKASTGTTLPSLPYDFPMFKHAFGGTTKLPWYIKLETTTHGQSQNKAKGKWSNSPPGFAEVDSDTWVTQAGQNTGGGVDPEEGSDAPAPSDL
jgi:hypothetical protein